MPHYEGYSKPTHPLSHTPEERLNKPPQGIMPEWLWREHRIKDLLEAALRIMGHVNHTNDRIIELLDELNQHNRWLKQNRDKEKK